MSRGVPRLSSSCRIFNQVYGTKTGGIRHTYLYAPFARNLYRTEVVVRSPSLRKWRGWLDDTILGPCPDASLLAIRAPGFPSPCPHQLRGLADSPNDSIRRRGGYQHRESAQRETDALCASVKVPGRSNASLLIVFYVFDSHSCLSSFLLPVIVVIKCSATVNWTMYVQLLHIMSLE